MSPCVSITVTSSRGGTTLLFHFLAYLHGRRHIRKFAAATFAKFSIDFSSKFSASASLSQSERDGGKGKGKAKGGRTYLFITAKAGKEVCAILAGGKNFLFWFYFVCLFFTRFEIKRGEGEVPFLDSC